MIHQVFVQRITRRREIVTLMLTIAVGATYSATMSRFSADVAGVSCSETSDFEAMAAADDPHQLLLQLAVELDDESTDTVAAQGGTDQKDGDYNISSSADDTFPEDLSIGLLDVQQASGRSHSKNLRRSAKRSSADTSHSVASNASQAVSLDVLEDAIYRQNKTHLIQEFSQSNVTVKERLQELLVKLEVYESDKKQPVMKDTPLMENGIASFLDSSTLLVLCLVVGLLLMSVCISSSRNYDLSEKEKAAILARIYADAERDLSSRMAKQSSADLPFAASKKPTSSEEQVSNIAHDDPENQA